MSDTQPESTTRRVRAEWGSVWLKARAKTHIMDACRYVSDDFRQVDVDAVPETHVDLCDWCADRFRNWRRGLGDAAADSACARCGRHDTTFEHCDDCRATIDRRRARR